MNKEQKTALNIQDFSLGSEDELYTKNYNNDGNHGGDSASVARGYILHHPEPKEGVRQVESDERKALPTPGMATCKLQSSKTEWLVQRTATGQCHQITTQEGGKEEYEYSGKPASQRLKKVRKMARFERDHWVALWKVTGLQGWIK